MHLRQRIVIGFVACGALVADLSFSSAALAAGGAVGPADASMDGQSVQTNVSIGYTGALTSSGIKDPPVIANNGPTCWLAPFGGDGATPVATYTPAEFGAYMDPIIAAGTGGSAGPSQSSLAYNYQTIYQKGSPSTNGVVGLTTPPYNKGQSGAWEWEVCSLNANYETVLELQKALKSNNDDESWYWAPNGNPPAGAGLSPVVLAEYAAASVTPNPSWPTTTPPFGVDPQTVNSASTISVTATTAAGQGYGTSTATARLVLDPARFSTVDVYPNTITISSPDLAKPVVCSFSQSGSVYVLNNCRLTFIRATLGNATVPVTGVEDWKADWTSKPAGAAGWPQDIPNVQLPTLNVKVQEIQTIVNPQPS